MPLRAVIALVAIVLLAGVDVAHAQHESKPVTVGVLSGQSREWNRESLEAFRRGLHELGGAEGTTLRIEERFADGPVTTKLVASLARPGGNVTGISNMAPGLTQKRLAILKEALPAASRIAMLSHPESLIAPPQWRDAEAAARQLGLRLQCLTILTRDVRWRTSRIRATDTAAPPRTSIASSRGWRRAIFPSSSRRSFSSRSRSRPRSCSRRRW